MADIAQSGPVKTSWFTNRRMRKIREAIEAYLFLSPGTFLLIAFNMVPIGYALYISMHKWRISKGDFIGLNNFLKAMGTPLDILFVVGGLLLLGASWMVWRKIKEDTPTHAVIFRILVVFMLIVGGMGLIFGFPKMLQNGDKALFESLSITFMYSLFTVPVQIVLSFLLAFILFQNIKGKTFWRILYFLPYITVTVASAAVWQSIFEPKKGLLNMILFGLGVAEKSAPRWLFEATGIGVLIGRWFGLEVPKWAGGPSLALLSVIIYNIWVYVGYNSVIYLAGLGNIPNSLYEAAEIDGANRWQVLRKITIPMVSPTTYFLVMMGILGTFRAFNHIYVMTGVVGPLGSPRGTTMTASMLIWKIFRENQEYGYSSAMAFILMGVMLGITWIQKRVSEEGVFYG
ncbi:MAG: sugar ABC transporter permease [Anaerolineae bacterium]|nr:sugar ABC transporter permease [Anaerolineae bacterium]